VSPQSSWPTAHFVPESPSGERRARAVTVVTLVTMAGELAAGWWTGSLALASDGWHMGTHAGALGLAALAYWYARTHARSGRYAFGTGKVYALSGFASSVGLLIAAGWMAFEGIYRLADPIPVAFAEALPVAALGLLVNVVSLGLLGDHGHDHGAGHVHGHGHGHGHGHDHGAGHDHAHPGADHNLNAAYLHVLADAATSVLAIGALLGGYFFGWSFLDPLMGVLGGLLILRWSVQLARETGETLLDVCPDPALVERIHAGLVSAGARVRDIHLWEIGPGHWACIVSVEQDTQRTLAEYRSTIEAITRIDHLTIEVHPG